jgi:hypothetical protein
MIKLKKCQMQIWLGVTTPYSVQFSSPVKHDLQGKRQRWRPDLEMAAESTKQCTIRTDKVTYHTLYPPME